MTASTRLAFGALFILSLACGTKSEVPPPAGETDTPTIEAAPGDVVPDGMPASDTTPGAPAAPAAPAAGAAPSSPTSAAKGGTVIGYDSAFGPSYALDSAGRPIPIKKRKP